MPIGNGGGVSGSGSAEFDVSYNFELFPLNDDGEPIEPDEITPNNTYTFSGVIENFTGGYQINSVDFGEGGLDGIWEYEQAEIFSPLTLDLTARYLSAGTTLTLLDGTIPFNLGDDPNGDGIPNDEIIIESDRIEYILSSPELKARGIEEFTLYVVDENPDPGVFELNGQEINLNDATTSIESILDVLSFPNELFRISATSETGQLYSFEGGFQESTIFIEAEELLTPGEDTYIEENFAEIETNDETEPANAIGISLVDVEAGTGEVSFKAEDYGLSLFNETTYDLEISYFDENDGKAEIQVLINGGVVGEPKILNENTSSGFPTENTRREYIVEDLVINSSDTITIRGIADGDEWARIDNISFSPANFTSEPRSPILIQAEELLTPGEDTYLEENFAEIETNDGTEPANATGISLINVEGGEGTASFLASEQDLSGVYDLEISYFDENDGEAQLQVLINGEIAKDISGEVVGKLILDENTRSGFPAISHKLS